MSTGTITVTATEPPVDADLARRRAARRLRPLYLALALGGLMLWVPVEKLFMTELGFDATAVGIMAGVYALVVPLLEVPSGILADRWSRKGVLMSAYAALLASVLVCGLAGDVTTYVIGAGLLGVYLALQSGTLESMVYDVLQEELGDGGGFEATHRPLPGRRERGAGRQRHRGRAAGDGDLAAAHVLRHPPAAGRGDRAHRSLP